MRCPRTHRVIPGHGDSDTFIVQVNRWLPLETVSARGESHGCRVIPSYRLPQTGGSHPLVFT